MATFNYIYYRVYLFIDEINEEEANESKDKPKAIIVYLLKPPYAIQPARYSKKLHNKTVESFTENDTQQRWDSVVKSVSTFLN